MKSVDIVDHLRLVLGSISTRYGSCYQPASVTNTLGDTTYVTEAQHFLKEGQGVIVSNVPQKYALEKMTVLDTGVVWCKTVSPHDLTENDFARPNVMVIGTGIPEIDSTLFKLVDVPSRYTFSFKLATPITPVEVLATGDLLDLYGSSFNGTFAANIIDKYTLSVDVPNITANDVAALLPNACIQHSIRVTGCVTEERFMDAYTKQSAGDVYLVVVLGDQTLSRDRNILSDGTQVKSAGDTKWMREIQTFDIFAVIPVTDSLLGAAAKDLACNEIKLDLYKALAGWKQPAEFDAEQKYVITPVSNSSAAYNGAYYAHRYTFEVALDISVTNTFTTYVGAGQEPDRAFRDIEFSLDIDVGGA